MQDRNVNQDDAVPAIPAAAARVIERMRDLPELPEIDQLTVNEYPAGVGLAPHIDTHSAFSGTSKLCSCHNSASKLETLIIQ